MRTLSLISYNKNNHNFIAYLVYLLQMISHTYVQVDFFDRTCLGYNLRLILF